MSNLHPSIARAALDQGVTLDRTSRADGRTAYRFGDELLTPGQTADLIVPGGREAAHRGTRVTR